MKYIIWNSYLYIPEEPVMSMSKTNVKKIVLSFPPCSVKRSLRMLSS